MKKIVIAAFVFVSLQASAQTSPKKTVVKSPATVAQTTTPGKAQVTPAIVPAAAPAEVSPAKFNVSKHSFGKIKQGTPVSYVFNLTNTSKKPLIIEQCTAQCGCTTPEYSKSPVSAGKSTPIKVTYNAASGGAFTKTVTVKFLGVANPTILTIEGEVLKADEPAKKP